MKKMEKIEKAEKEKINIPGGGMKNFEERLKCLEDLGEKIRKPEIPLDEALKAFEEGIKLAQTLEKDLEKVENRIEILMTGPDVKSSKATPELGFFDEGS